MVSHPRRVRKLFSGIVVCAAIVFGVPAHSQAANKTQQPGTGPDQAATTDAGVEPGFDSAESRREGYRGFLMVVAGQEPRPQNGTANGMQIPPIRVSYVKLLRISEDEERIMRAICVDSWERISEPTSRTMRDLLEARDRGASREEMARLKKRNEEAEANAKVILDETIANLRQAFGEEDFKRLDAFVYRVSPQGLMDAQDAMRRSSAGAKSLPGAPSFPLRLRKGWEEQMSAGPCSRAYLHSKVSEIRSRS